MEVAVKSPEGKQVRLSQGRKREHRLLTPDIN